MAEEIVSDWLAEYNSLEPQEIRSFAALHVENHELSTAIQTILSDKSKHSDLLHPICIQLYNFYRSNESELKCFMLQFIPNFIYLYLNAVATPGEKQNYRCVETLLLCAYNFEVCNEKGALSSVSFRMPVLAQASIYHEERNLHASDLKRWEENGNKEITWRSTSQVYKITTQNRLSVMTALVFIFNQQLSSIQKASLYHLCSITSKMVSQGFAKHGHSYRASYGNDPLNTSMSSASMVSSTTSAPSMAKQNPRIPMSQPFLVELLHAIYFAMFNEFASAAIQAVDDIHNRACYELFPDVILVTNAIKNSLQANPSGQPSDGPMGISVALTPATTVVTVSKSMITNASFRTKKLPDDLEIVDLKHLQATQEEMMKKLSIVDDETVSGELSEPTSASATPKGQKRSDGLRDGSRRHRWKNWGWKHSPAKSSSIEEEPVALLESPKRSHSSKSSTPNQSPKHRNKINSSELVANGDDATTPFRRRKQQQQQKSETSRTELRSSAGARLTQLFDNKDEKLNSDCDEFRALLPENGRPASVHITQTLQHQDDF